MRFLYINVFILETCHICMDTFIISLHGNVNNSKFIKKRNSPESRPATPLRYSKQVYAFYLMQVFGLSVISPDMLLFQLNTCPYCDEQIKLIFFDLS